MKGIYIIQIALLLSINTFAQNKSVFSKYFVKENCVLLRWIPSDKEVFDIGAKNGYKVTRYVKDSNVLSSPVIIADQIKPIPSNDSIAWSKLIKKNSIAPFIYNTLYPVKNSKAISKKENPEASNMLYGLMLLSCDFDADIARASGLFFKDSTASPNTTYTYKIEINHPPATLKIAPANSDINTAILTTNPEISNLTGKFKNQIAKLNWKAVDYAGSYGGYNVERSSDNVSFQKVNKSPAILMSSQFEKNKENISYEDTVPQSGIKYYYRIRGITIFGEESEPSNIISGIGYEELQSNPAIDSLTVVKNRKVFLRWTMSDPKENTLPKEYILMRSGTDNGKYSMLHKSFSELSFTDESPKQSNYYKVGAVTHGNDTLFSFTKLALITDTIPPIAPSGLKAKVDTKGNVEISWDKNPENDIKGYKIYKANALTEEFVQMNSEFAKEPHYKDKLNLKTLSQKIYYSVVATDNNYNNSELSKPIEVKRPDTIPPVAAIIRNLQITQNGIKVFWIPSSSEDVKQYILYHEDEVKKSTDKIRNWNPSDSTTSFLDTTVEFGTGYRYKIIAMDEDDNISVSNNPYMYFETGFRKKIKEIKNKVDRTEKTITIYWNYLEYEVEKFIIYRAREKEKLTIIKTVSHPTSTFTDNTLSIGNKYEYRIKAVFYNGAESILSDAVIVEY